jgi:uncharacterized membrane protein YeaQ/YmgE (transglycosylase-associated protein family)
MPVEIVMWVVAGLIVGWLAGSRMRGGYGIFGDIAIAVVGGIAGAWLVTAAVPEATRGGLAGTVIAAVVSAAIFVGLARLLSRRSAAPRSGATD